MIILIKRIPPEGENLTGVDPCSMMEVDEPDVHFRQDIRHDLHVQVQGNALLVTGTLDTAVVLRCGRCLREFTRPLRVAQFVVHQPLAGEDSVDLTANVREDILLELPQRALCSPDCKGLCPVCGQDLNTKTCGCKPSTQDLRWQALDKININ
jgi:uncharacterized protein